MRGNPSRSRATELAERGPPLGRSAREGREGAEDECFTERKTHQRPEAGVLRVLRALANGAERGQCVRGQASTLAGTEALGTPSEPSAAPRPVLQRVLLVLFRQREPPPTAGALPPRAGRPRVHLRPLPTPGSRKETRGQRRGGEVAMSGRGRDGTYLPWASRMAA